MTARAQSLAPAITRPWSASSCSAATTANNLLVPNDSAGYANYQKIRQNLALTQGSLIGIHDPATGASYGLHPSFAPIAPLYNTSKRLALLMNVGTLLQPVPRGSNGLPQLSAVPLPVNLYSHSDQQSEWQNGDAAGRRDFRLVRPPGRQDGRLFLGRRAAGASTIAGNALQLVGQSTQPSAVSTSNFGLVAPRHRSGIRGAANSAQPLERRDAGAGGAEFV